MRIEVAGVHGLPEIARGDDLGALIAAHADLRDGDVVVVAQKIVSKAEGRVVAVPPADRARERARLAAAEAVRVVARRGDTLIVRTRHGFVCAAAGIDGSNLPPDRLALLPEDPDASAERLRARLGEVAGARVGVIVSDTFGRPWRVGQTNVALGVAGVRAIRDHRGEKDAFGTPLEATQIAVADEIAAAAELVMRKSDGVPVAIVRGLEGHAAEASARELVRPEEEDLFPTGPIEALEARRSVRDFAGRAVPDDAIARAVEAAATAPAPHGSRVARPWRFVWLRSPQARAGFLDAMRARWREDLEADGTPPETIVRRAARSDALLGRAPVLLACFVSLEGMDDYAGRARGRSRARAEREMFVAAAGAAIQNLMVALAAQGVGSCWVSSSIFCPDEAARALGLRAEWAAVGCVAAGYPAERPPPRAPRDADGFLDVR